jgi:formylglycine-generating enzyme required for sulfatase activity
VVYGYPADSGTNDNLSPVIYGNDGMQMMLIPAGEFVMGSNKGESFEKPEHIVYLDAFYMDIYEVTNAQYQEFVRATGRKEPVGLSYNIYNLSESPTQGFRPWQDANFNGYKQPVVCVSYDDAQAYAKWAGKRLPTEAEWEKAARNKRANQDFSWGNTWSPPNRIANFRDEAFKRLTRSTESIISNYDDGYAYTSPAGEYAPNAYGLFDIDGNVAEICSDWVGNDYYSISPKRNPTGPSSGQYRIFRGSGFLSVDRDMIRIFSRFSFEPNTPMFFIGFRCVKDAK